MEDIDAAFFRGVTRESDSSSTGSPSGNDDSSKFGSDSGTTKGAPDHPSGGPPSQQSTPSTGVTLSGLLGAIDGVAAQEGRLLFATTNKYKSLDPALIRPGRLDVHVQFDNAGKWQIEELFRCFFPPSEKEDGEKEGEDVGEEKEGEDDTTLVASEGSLTPPDTPSATSTTASTSTSSSKPSALPSAIFTSDPGAHSPTLSARQVNRLAKLFAQRIPDREFSMAAIQGLLMQYKTRPFMAVDDAEKWVQEERKKKAEREGKKVEGGGKDEKKDGKSDEKREGKKGEGGVLTPSLWWTFGAI
jgi:chaperone BCS1